MKDKIDAFVCALKARGCSSRTIETYRWRLTQLREATGKPTLAISAEDLDQYIVDLWARNLSPVTVATRIQSIKTYFKWCVERSYLDRSPAMHLKKPKLERLCSDAMEEENLQLLLPFFVCSHTISMSLLQTLWGEGEGILRVSLGPRPEASPGCHRGGRRWRCRRSGRSGG